MEGTMKPRTLIVAAGLAVVALATPTDARSARVTIGAVFSAGMPYPPQARYPEQRSPASRRPVQGWYGGREVALNRGVNDGYEQGFEAARHRDRYDPSRERWYRDATRGYDRDYRMAREDYRDIYRRGFLEGYEAGYRDALRGWQRGYGGYGRDSGRYNRPPQGGWRW